MTLRVTTKDENNRLGALRSFNHLRLFSKELTSELFLS